MKKLLLILSVASMLVIPAIAQTTATNGDTVLTISNGMVVLSSPLTNPPVLVNQSGQVVPQAFVDELADSTGIPREVIKLIPLKYLFWLFVLSVGTPVIARYLRKGLPDSWQTGKAGLILRHAANEINPTLPSMPIPASPKIEPEQAPTPPPQV